jgi:hypothetical protein
VYGRCTTTITASHVYSNPSHEPCHWYIIFDPDHGGNCRNRYFFEHVHEALFYMLVLPIYEWFLDEVWGHGFIWITEVSSTEAWIQNAPLYL